MEELAFTHRDFSRFYSARLERVMAKMDAAGVDALVLSLGADLPWLTGYEAMPLERLTALVVRRGEVPTLVVPALEAPRVHLRDGLFVLRPWHEYEDPHAIVSEELRGCRNVGISERAWAATLLKLQSQSPVHFLPASEVTKSLRSVKDPVEIEMLRGAATRTDAVAEALVTGEIEVLGRSEREISMEISERLLAEGLRRVNFAIVGSGPNSASPHHEAGKRIVGSNEAIVCDFGGEFGIDGEVGYCSDITRTVVTGEMPERFVELYAILQEAQARQINSVRDGVSYESIDIKGRSHIEECGYGEYFIHRTGHGIGVEEHEEPYIITGNMELVQIGNAFSIEPGIYVPGLYGARIEDIVVATSGGCEILNKVEKSLHVVA